MIERLKNTNKHEAEHFDDFEAMDLVVRGVKRVLADRQPEPDVISGEDLEDEAEITEPIEITDEDDEEDEYENEEEDDDYYDDEYDDYDDYYDDDDDEYENNYRYIYEHGEERTGELLKEQ